MRVTRQISGALATAGGVDRWVTHNNIRGHNAAVGSKGRCADAVGDCGVVGARRGRRATRQYKLQEEVYERRIVCDAGDRRVVDMIAI